MNKKILALALAIVLIATAFTACKRGPELTEINGNEYPLATDSEGNTIINEDNQIAVLVTDREGEVLTHSDGENQTHWMQINGPLVVGDYVKTKEGTLAIPNGWEANEINGRVVKKNTDENCYISFGKSASLKEDETLELYLEELDAQNNAIAEAFADEEQMNALAEKDPRVKDFMGSVYTMEDKGNVTIAGVYNGERRVHTIVDKNGNIIHYVDNYYFVADDTIYSINYVCEEGQGYDPSFNFAQYVSECFVFNGEKD